MWEVHFAVRGLPTKVSTFRTFADAIRWADSASRGAYAIARDTPWLRRGIAVSVRKAREGAA